jgi:hypothetical protein
MMLDLDDREGDQNIKRDKVTRRDKRSNLRWHAPRARPLNIIKYLPCWLIAANKADAQLTIITHWRLECACLLTTGVCDPTN